MAKEDWDAALADLRAEAARNKSVDESALTLIQGLAKQLEAMAGANPDGVDPQELRNVAADLRAQNDAFAASISANTPKGEEVPDTGTPGTDFDPNPPERDPETGERVGASRIPGQPGTVYPGGVEPAPYPTGGYPQNPDMTPPVPQGSQPTYPEDTGGATPAGSNEPSDAKAEAEALSKRSRKKS